MTISEPTSETTKTDTRLSEPQITDTPRDTENGISPVVAARMATCQQIADGISDRGFGFDLMAVTTRAEASAVCRLLVAKGLCTEEELAIEVYAGVQAILANTLQRCEVQLATMDPLARAQHLAAAAARKAEIAAQEKEQAATPAAQGAKRAPLATVRTRDQLLVARR